MSSKPLTEGQEKALTSVEETAKMQRDAYMARNIAIFLARRAGIPTMKIAAAADLSQAGVQLIIQRMEKRAATIKQ